jgi:hypothetical protein
MERPDEKRKEKIVKFQKEINEKPGYYEKTNTE